MKSILPLFILILLIALMSSSIAQVDWDKYDENPVFLPGAPGDWDEYLGSFCILFHDDTLHMWYGGWNGTNNRIGYAYSPDGIIWTKYEGNPVLDIGSPGCWDDQRVISPYVIFDSDTFSMWYWAKDNSGNPYSIGYATSTDKVTWTKYEHNPVLTPSDNNWESVSVIEPCVYYDGTTYHMWYAGSDGYRINIGYATSPDGIIWEKYAGNPVLYGNEGAWDSKHVRAHKVLFDGNIFHMWYTGTTTSINDWEYQIGYATSDDGITWIKFDHNPVLSPTEGEWDSQWAGFPGVLWDSTGQQFKMWYGGGADDVVKKIGYATAPFSVMNVPNQYTTIQQAIDAAVDGNVILVDEGTYYENINFKGKAITVASHYWFDGDTSHISKTIIDGSQPANSDSSSVVSFISNEDTTSVLLGFTITGGSGTYNDTYDCIGGGGIYMLAGGKIIHNVITDNHLEYNGLTAGAGLLYLAQSKVYNVSFKQNIVTHNSATSHSVVASGGGGIYFKCVSSSGGSIRIANNTISHNMATNTARYKTIAGGIGISLNLPFAVDAVIENNCITYNELHCTASIGAGIYVVYWNPDGQFTDSIPTPTIQNNIIANNYSQDRGAGIGIWTVQKNNTANPNSKDYPQPAIINNTIVNNKANDGCGIFNFDSYPLLMNNILWNDLSVEGSREIFNDDITYPDYTQTNEGEPNIYYSDIQGGYVGEGNIDSDPMFGEGTYNLSKNSYCIGNGVISIEINGITYDCPAIDHFGNPRPYPQDSNPDIGAIEDSLGTDIERIYYNLPKEFALFQNYPNPFNPVTVISWQLAVSSHVNLSVYNVLGQKVATLVNKKQPAGSYQVQWDAGNFATGIYYYKLSTKGFQQVKKMVLMK